MSLKVMLVNPPVFQVEEPWYDTPNFGRTGLAYLAGYLRQYPGFEIKIIDSKFERIDFEQTLKQILEFKPDVVGIGAFTNEIKPAAYLAKLIKEKLPNVITIIGSVHVTAIPKRTMEEFPEFDIGVIGEGEITFYELCTAIKNGQDIHNINGLAYRDGHKIILTELREKILDQDSIPLPAWDMLPKAEMYIVMTLRGCPFNCVFCMNPNGRVARTRSVDNVIEELKLIIEKFHPQEIKFGDELFSVDMDRTKELLTSMLEHRLQDHISWTAQTHVRFVDFELFSLMKKSNLKMIGLGIETGDEAKLKNMGKGTNLEMIHKARKAAKDANVPIETYFVIGQPNETMDSIKKTIDLAVKLNPTLPIFGLMSPYPGTEVARLAALGQGGYRLVTTDWNEYNKQIGGALEFANLSRSQIERIQMWAYAKVFLYNYRFLDFLKFLWHYRVGALSMIKNTLGIKSKNKYAEIEKEKTKKITKKELEEIVMSTVVWQKTQISELARAKREKPRTIKIQYKNN